MNKVLTLLAASMLFLGTMAFAGRPQAILGPGTGSGNFRVPYHETSDRVLSRDTTYILTGWYFIDSTYSITIPSGTLIRGDSTSGGALIIKRGAKIHASGTKEAPIIFTSNKPAGTRVPGDWGGVIVLGSAPTNQPATQQIEGGFATVPGATAMYGGADPNDNSGELEYIRIEFAGIAFAVDNEINGLTFGGVGAGTTINHIQVSLANDDDFEFFGGTLQAKYLIAWRSLDDTYDTDFGFSGKLQYIYTKRDPTIFDASAAGQSNGFESDNNATAPFTGTPNTHVRISNATIIGPAKDSAAANLLNSKWGFTSLLRRNTQLSIFNSVLAGWKNGIQLRDTLTQRSAINEDLQIRNTSIAAPRQTLTLNSNPATGNIAGFDVIAWFNTLGWGNIGSAERQASDLGYNAALFNFDNSNDPVPPVGTEPDTAGTSYQGSLAGDSFYDSVGYRGAFDPNLGRHQQWDWGWANYDPQNYDPEAATSTVNYTLSSSWNMISLPFREVTNSNVHVLFPTATTNAFSYAGSYQQQTNLTHAQGYWLKFAAPETSDVIGAKAVVDTFHLNTNWNIVGSVAVSMPVASLVVDPPGVIVSPFYGYNGAYSTVSTLEPGHSYWVKTNAPGQIYVDGFAHNVPKLQAVGNPENLGLTKLEISDRLGHSQNLYLGEDKENRIAPDRYALPPLPPEGGFDARFASGRMVEVGATQGSEYRVNVRGGTYPLSISVAAGSASLQIREVTATGGVRIHELTGGANVVLQNDNFDHLVVTMGQPSAKPTAFALNQNYPNPFNPSTHIDIDVPNDSKVNVSIYNVLGQKVATLVDGLTSAGFHTLEWNGQDTHGAVLPSGIYFVRMTGEKFSAVRKIMMMK